MKRGLPMVVEWEIASQFGQERIVLREIKSILRDQHIVEKRIDEIATAVGEACINAIEHGNKLNARQQVRIQMTIVEKDCILRIYDGGEGFVPQMPTDKSITAQHAKANPRGWGVMLMTAFANSVTVGRARERFYVELTFQIR